MFTGKKLRFVAYLLLLTTLIGCCAVFMSIPAAAADEPEEEEVVAIQDFTIEVYKNPEEKLATMTKVYEKSGYELYYQDVTGEVAVRVSSTGQLLFSNPYDVASEESTSTPTRYNLLSQIIIKYKDDTSKEYYSNTYKDSAMNRQIKMKKIKGGIRVEYSMGKEEKRKLVPKWIEKSSFEQNILQYFPEGTREWRRIQAFYTLKDASSESLTQRAKVELKLKYPITNTYAIYIFDPLASERELSEIEGYIKKYTNNTYTFEKLDEDHALVGYEGRDKAPPLFKMALEYYLDDEGLMVRLPANGIRFDESVYKLEYINMLPYMGANRRENTGYLFIPDGSGAIIRSEDIKDRTFNVKSMIYGPDYSFYKISGQHNQKWRMPVYGIIENHTVTTEHEEEEIVPAEFDEEGNEIAPETTKTVTVKDSVDRTDGFFAVIEEGDAMAEIFAECGANQNKYNTVYTYLAPRPTDSFYLDVASTGLNSMMTVVSKRKYNGNYKLRYFLLTGEEASYVGMAKVYREYLEKRGMLSRLQTNGEDIPLYLETFGYIQTAERAFGFPYEADTPLTSSEDTKIMIDKLNDAGIKNLNIKMTGWQNNGMYSRTDTSIKFNKSTGGKKGFEDLIAYAKEKGTTLYPAFNFAITYWDRPFDKFSYKKDASKTLENRVAIESKYDFVAQDFYAYYVGMVISPKYMDKMYGYIKEKYEKFDVGGICVASLGEELHSDHNKKGQINRADSQVLVSNVLAKIKEDNEKVWLSGGNIYTLQYGTTLVNAPLESSQHNEASASVPFYSMVVHGYIDFAGTPINMVGDYKRALLKSVESGANPYFIASYRNTAKLKLEVDTFNNYFSVDFKNWLPDMISTYNHLNEILKPLRDLIIVNHELIDNGKQVIVTYENGTQLLLNYDSNPYEYEGKTVEPLEFIKLK